MQKFDEVTIQQPDGTQQRLTADEFFKLKLVDRVNLLCGLKVRFFKAGRPVPATEAMK